jgi:hypothetical protein
MENVRYTTRPNEEGVINVWRISDTKLFLMSNE